MSHDDPDLHDHDRGLAFDLSTLLDRRRALKLFAGAGVVAVAGCAGSDVAATAPSTSSSAAASAAGTASAAAAACEEIPEETAGPFPGDGSNGPNVLNQTGIVRTDIRSSFGSMTGTAEGVRLTITMTILDLANGCAPKPGAAVYLWHCDREGRYSLYSGGATDQNYLRGVQAADSKGRVTFTSVFPAAYSGRWPHIHFEVYPSLADATGGTGKLATSQIALPEDTSKQVFATSGYEASVGNLAQTSLATDMVFSDGWSRQLGKVTGSVSSGYTVELTVPV